MNLIVINGLAIVLLPMVIMLVGWCMHLQEEVRLLTKELQEFKDVNHAWEAWQSDKLDKNIQL